MGSKITVAIYGRVSTSNQEYDRQVSELRETAKIKGWEVAVEFCEKVSGAKKNHEREELVKMMEFIRENNINKVLVTELSRLGRSTVQVLELIEQLNERQVSVYIKNLGIETLDDDGRENKVSSLLVTIIAELAKMERENISERMQSGFKNYIQNGGVVGRKLGYRKSDEQFLEENRETIRLLRLGYKLTHISDITKKSINTIRKVRCLITAGHVISTSEDMIKNARKVRKEALITILGKKENLKNHDQ